MSRRSAERRTIPCCGFPRTRVPIPNRFMMRPSVVTIVISQVPRTHRRGIRDPVEEPLVVGTQRTGRDRHVDLADLVGFWSCGGAGSSIGEIRGKSAGRVVKHVVGKL